MKLKTLRSNNLLANILLALALALMMGVSAFAQTFVSGAGSDSFTCGSADPCRTLTRALATAPVGGSVILMDAGPYEPFIINRTVNVIAAPGTAPRILAPIDGRAITVALPPGEGAYLEGLTINADKSGSTGIRWTMPGKLLWLKNCVVSDFFIGLSVIAGGNILVDNCTFRNGSWGMYMDTSSETDHVYATIQFTVIQAMDIAGIQCGDNTDVGIRGCQISLCGVGIMAAANASTSAHAYVTVMKSSIFKNTFGVSRFFLSPTRSVIRLGYNAIFKNTVGIDNGCDLGGNSVFGNGSPAYDELWMSGHAPACTF